MILLKIPILGDLVDLIADLTGLIMNFLFMITGGQNIGLCIILFTIVVRLLMLPMTIKQQKFSKLSSMMQPELQAIQNKYKGKQDNASMMKMQEETKAVYEKYGTSPTGGCLQLFIQLPIFYGIYAVVRNIPQYVTSVKELFNPIMDGIKSIAGYEQTLVDSKISMYITKPEFSDNKLLEALNAFSPDDWEKLKDVFPTIASTITQYSEEIISMNNFFGINLAASPGFKISAALIIPLLAGITQWLSVTMMQNKNQNGNDDENPAAQSMKMMNTMMPVISAIFCISMPAGLGLYWIMGSVVQIVQQLFINKYMESVSVEEMMQRELSRDYLLRSLIHQQLMITKKQLRKERLRLPEEATELKRYRNLQNTITRMQSLVHLQPRLIW